MNDVKKALKEISDAMDKLQIPRLSFKPIHMNFTYNTGLEEKISKLEQVSGMSVNDLIDKFAAGWELKPPGIEECIIRMLSEDELKQMYKEEISKMNASIIDEIRRAGYLDAGEQVIPPLQISFEQLNNPTKECDKLDVEVKDGVAIIEMEESSDKKYKIEIWVYGRVEETYEHDDIEEVLKWYRVRWKHIYDCGGCCFDIYENDRILEFEEESALGFYE